MDAKIREILPIPNRVQHVPTAMDVGNQTGVFTPVTALRPPEGAPNVVPVLIDDMGFGASSAFGGPCEMPTAERLSSSGLRYSRFHVTALCSPTRQALLTGRNNHSVGMGVTTEMSTSALGTPASVRQARRRSPRPSPATGTAPRRSASGTRLRRVHLLAHQ